MSEFDWKDFWRDTRAYRIREYLRFRGSPFLKTRYRKGALEAAREWRALQ